MTEVVGALFPGLAQDDVQTLTTYVIAGADGLFVQREINGDAVDLVAMFELHARIVYETAARMAARSEDENMASRSEG
jgi:hypothetical protein